MRRCRAAILIVCLLLPLLAGCTVAASGEGNAPLPAAQAASILRLARAARGNNDLATAMSFYRDLAMRAQADDTVLIEYGNVLTELGAGDDALDVFSKLRTDGPSRVPALLGQGHAYLVLGQPAKALEAMEAARAVAPGETRAIIGVAVALDMLERHREAQAIYHEVLATNPRHVAARNNLALSLALTGEFAQALEIVTPMAASPNATPRVRQNLALIYGLMGDRGRAEAVSRMDLDAPATAANLRFFALVRGTGG